MANALDTLTEIVKILDCAQNKDLRISTAIEKAAFSACIILLQQLQTPTGKQSMYKNQLNLPDIPNCPGMCVSFLSDYGELKYRTEFH